MFIKLIFIIKIKEYNNKDFNSLVSIYGTNLMELTYQHKMHESTVTRVNKIFHNILDNFIQILTVNNKSYKNLILLVLKY